MAGGLGCLGLGMMTRVALGHSGHPIMASPWMRLSFVIVIVAGLLRVASYGPWRWSGLTSLTLSAAAWSLAFLIYRSEEHTSELQSLMRNSYAVFCFKQKIYSLLPTINKLQDQTNTMMI